MRPAFSRRLSATPVGEEADRAPWPKGFYPARPSSSTCSRYWRGQSKRPTRYSGGPFYAAEMRSGSQLPQYVAVLLLQLPERPVTKLTNPLPGYSHHPADLFQGPAVAIIQAEIQPEHLGIARRQRRQRQLEIVCSAARQG